VERLGVEGKKKGQKKKGVLFFVRNLRPPWDGRHLPSSCPEKAGPPNRVCRGRHRKVPGKVLKKGPGFIHSGFPEDHSSGSVGLSSQKSTSGGITFNFRFSLQMRAERAVQFPDAKRLRQPPRG